MTVYYDDGSKGTTLYSRYLMQTHLGRRLERHETVDHVNEDKSDDRVENFQLLTIGENIAKSTQLRRPTRWYEFECPICKAVVRKPLRQVEHNRKQCKTGPYCSRKCARAWQIKNCPPTRRGPVAQRQEASVLETEQ